MNLFYYPSLSELNLLLNDCNHAVNFFDIAVEHDGEVLAIESSLQSKKSLGKYKFYFKGLLSKKQFNDNDPVSSLVFLNQLFKNLDHCWQNNLRGSVNFNRVTNLLERRREKEIQKIKKQQGLAERLVRMSARWKKSAREHASFDVLKESFFFNTGIEWTRP